MKQWTNILINPLKLRIMWVNLFSRNGLTTNRKSAQ